MAAKPSTPKVDVSISGSMGLYMFHVHTVKARRWIARHVRIAEWQGDAEVFACDDTRYAQDIAEAMRDAGFKIV